MVEKTKIQKKPISADWLIQGVLTRLGDTFDRLTGRGWKPSSSLATSELAERLKALVDTEAREADGNRKFVPHHISLRVQWDKFSTDSEDSLRKLETELLTALVDHINDRRYYTYGSISLTVKPDYFTDGVKLLASFNQADEDEREVSVDVTVPNVKIEIPELERPKEIIPAFIRLAIQFDIGDHRFEKILEMDAGKRFTVGRTKESDIAIDDPSVSKMHAALLLNNEGQLVIADTGSTNGTFIDDERIAYGKAIPLSSGEALRLGTVKVEFEVLTRREPKAAADIDAEPALENSYRVGEFEFVSKEASADHEPTTPAPTLPAVVIPESAFLKPLCDDSPPATSPTELDSPSEDVQKSK